MQTYIETSAWMGTARGPINFWDRLFESWQDLFVDSLTHNNEILLLDLFNQRFFLKAKASPSLSILQFCWKEPIDVKVKFLDLTMSNPTWTSIS